MFGLPSAFHTTPPLTPCSAIPGLRRSANLKSQTKARKADKQRRLEAEYEEKLSGLLEEVERVNIEGQEL